MARRRSLKHRPPTAKQQAENAARFERIERRTSEYINSNPEPEHIPFNIFDIAKMPEVDAEQWKSFYREVAKKIHPDIGGSSEHMAILSEMNEVMTKASKNAEIKRIHDEWSDAKYAYINGGGE